MRNIISVVFVLLVSLVSISATAVLSPALEGENILVKGTAKTETKFETKFTDKKGLVVVFLSAKCPCSNSHVGEIKTLAEKYRNFRFVAVHSNPDESAEVTKKYFESIQLPFPVIHDPKTKIADELKAYKTPHSYIIGPQGEVLYQGGVTSSANASKAETHYLAQVLDDLEAGKAPRISESRTLGCVIARDEDNKNVW